MQLLLLSLAAALIHSDRGYLRAATEDRGDVSGDTCEEKASTLLFLHDAPGPRATKVSRTPERALDYCGLKHEADKKYMCSYFSDFVRDAFAHEDPKAAVSPSSYCHVVQQHAGDVHEQVQMFEALSHYWGLNSTEKTSQETHNVCLAEMARAIAPDEAVPKEKAADSLYMFCINYNECDHHTMVGGGHDCETSTRPSTGKHLCELLRSDVEKLTDTRPQDAYAPNELCGWLLGFTDRQAQQNEAYRYVWHGEESQPSIIPEVGPAMDALLLTRLANGAKAHYVRDHQAHYVERASLAATLFFSFAL